MVGFLDGCLFGASSPFPPFFSLVDIFMQNQTRTLVAVVFLCAAVAAAGWLFFGADPVPAPADVKRGGTVAVTDTAFRPQYAKVDKRDGVKRDRPQNTGNADGLSNAELGIGESGLLEIDPERVHEILQRVDKGACPYGPISTTWAARVQFLEVCCPDDPCYGKSKEMLPTGAPVTDSKKFAGATDYVKACVNSCIARFQRPSDPPR